MRIAESRADVDVLLDTLRGTHPMSLANRIGAVVISVCIGGLAIMFVAGDHALWFMVPLSVGLIALFLDEGFATLIADASGFTRRSLFRNWHVEPHEVRSIEVPLGKPVLIIVTVADKRRAVAIEGTAKKALATLYPELFAPEARPL